MHLDDQWCAGWATTTAASASESTTKKPDQSQCLGQPGSTRQVIEELPANGTSGHYFNIRAGIVNSEQIEILTRDRISFKY